MRSVLEDVLRCVVGAVEVERTQSGVLLHRTSTRAREQIADPAFGHVSATPSGIRIEAVTDAAWLELDLELMRAFIVGTEVQPTHLDLVVDGVLRPPLPITSQTLAQIDPLTSDVDLEPAGPAAYRFDLGSAGVTRGIEIWLPTAARTVLLDARIPADATIAPVPATSPRWVHYGSSISQCCEVERPTQAWPAIVARRSGHSLLNMGLAGQCQLDQSIARTIRDCGAAAISLEIGINIAGGDTMRDRTFVSALHGFLDTIREDAPDTPILVMSPIYCGPIENAPGPTLWGLDGRVHATDRPAPLVPGTLSLTRIRALIEELVRGRRVSGDSRLFYVDGLALLGADDSAALPDDVHPSTAGYALLADRFYPVAFGPGGVLRQHPEPFSIRRG